MTIEFPEGNLIGLAKEQLPVIVTFASPKPISFTANIEFMDEEGKRFSIPVTATADNCLLTHQAFMKVRVSQLSETSRVSLGSGSEKHPSLRLTSNTPTHPHHLTPIPTLSFLSSPDSHHQANESMLVISSASGEPVSLVDRPDIHFSLPDPRSALGPTATSQGICRYLAATTGRGPMEQLVQQLVGSRGKLAVELVELLSGKQVRRREGRFVWEWKRNGVLRWTLLLDVRCPLS
jgi:hypothetical protein